MTNPHNSGYIPPSPRFVRYNKRYSAHRVRIYAAHGLVIVEMQAAISSSDVLPIYTLRQEFQRLFCELLFICLLILETRSQAQVIQFTPKFCECGVESGGRHEDEFRIPINLFFRRCSSFGVSLFLGMLVVDGACFAIQHYIPLLHHISRTLVNTVHTMTLVEGLPKRPCREERLDLG